MHNRYRTFDLSLENENVHLSLANEMYTQKRVWDARRHCHAEYELHVILKGSSTVAVEDRNYLLDEGSVILIAPGKYHYPVQTDTEFTRFSFFFAPEDGILKRNLKLNVPVCKVVSATQQICGVCNDVLYESAAGNPFRSDLQRALLMQLIIQIFRLLRLWDKKDEVSHILTGVERVAYIDDFFENNFAETAGEEMLAEQLGLSKRQLARVLQKNYGMGYRQKLICARMDRAAWLLRTTHKPISQVAEDVGYVSESAFYQVFRRHFHMTPQQYRSSLGHPTVR